MLSCLSIVFAKLTGASYAGNELPEPDDAGTTYYDDYIELHTVTRCNVQRELVYDEGDTRILYHDHVIEIEAVLTNTQDFGPLTNPGGDNAIYTFDEKLEIISNYLASQGLGINFGKYPAAIKNIFPGNENNNQTAQYTGYHGWLVDNFNGPKTDSIVLEALAGDGTARLTMRTRYRTFHTDAGLSSENTVPPKISSELRLDIDQDGDIVIMVDGTIYADSLRALYQARNWLEIVYQPTKVENIIQTINGNIQDDYFAVVNGFQKTVKFNVEKNGRSARFAIHYKQVKSNNAYPLGLRDIEFVQTLESNLFASDFKSGKGFRSWKNTFKGKITVPSRLDNAYVWYVFHLLVQQQMRNTVISFSSKDWDGNSGGLVDKASEASSQMVVKRKYARALPTKLKITNNHYERELSFEIDYVIICPIQYVLAVSCVLNRVNNDYQRRMNEGYTYKPLKLSAQWWHWNRSVDTGVGFNPDSPGATNPYAAGRPHLDGAGTEIIDTGHNYDPYKDVDFQNRQRNVLITTVFDPNEKDRTYETRTPTVPSASGYHGMKRLEIFRTRAESEAASNPGSTPPTPPAPVPSAINNWTGLPPFNPFQSLLTDVRGKTPEYDPKSTWLKYEQDYEIVEEHNTVAAMGMADMDASYYVDQAGYNKYVVNEDASSEGVPINPLEISDDDMPPNQVGMKILNRTSHNEITIEKYEEAIRSEDSTRIADANSKLVTHRKTYASSPSRFYVIVRGVAIRAAFKIPMPQVITIAGEKAIRVGEGRFKHKNLAPDADLPVYMAMWEQTYTVDKNVLSEDILSSIVDTGASMLYA